MAKQVCEPYEKVLTKTRRQRIAGMIEDNSDVFKAKIIKASTNEVSLMIGTIVGLCSENR